MSSNANDKSRLHSLLSVDFRTLSRLVPSASHLYDVTSSDDDSDDSDYSRDDPSEQFGGQGDVGGLNRRPTNEPDVSRYQLPPIVLPGENSVENKAKMVLMECSGTFLDEELQDEIDCYTLNEAFVGWKPADPNARYITSAKDTPTKPSQCANNRAKIKPLLSKSCPTSSTATTRKNFTQNSSKSLVKPQNPRRYQSLLVDVDEDCSSIDKQSIVPRIRVNSQNNDFRRNNPKITTVELGLPVASVQSLNDFQPSRNSESRGRPGIDRSTTASRQSIIQSSNYPEVYNLQYYNRSTGGQMDSKLRTAETLGLSSGSLMVKSPNRAHSPRAVPTGLSTSPYAQDAPRPNIELRLKQLRQRITEDETLTSYRLTRNGRPVRVDLKNVSNNIRSKDWSPELPLVNIVTGHSVGVQELKR